MTTTLTLTHSSAPPPACSSPTCGGPEDRLRAAFSSAYSLLASICRSPSFHESLSTTHPIDLIDAHMAVAHGAMHEATTRELTSVVAAGHAAGQLQALGFTKALTFPTSTRYVPPPLRPLHALNLPPSYIRIRPARFGRGLGNAPLTHIQAARDLSLDLVTHIDQTQRDAIATFIEEAIRRGIDAQVTGNRVANIVGLFPRWQKAVENLHARMIANGIPGHVAQQRADDYADELRDKRGMNIARTELLRGLNQGRLNSWGALAAEGVIDPDKSIKEWSSAPYACDACAELGDPKRRWSRNACGGNQYPI